MMHLDLLANAIVRPYSFGMDELTHAPMLFRSCYPLPFFAMIKYSSSGWYVAHNSSMI